MKFFKMLSSILLVLTLIFVSTGTTLSAQELQNKNLKITAENCNVIVAFSKDGQYRYDFNGRKFNLTTTSNNSTFEIKFSKIDDSTVCWEDNITIYIPNQEYNLVTGNIEKGSLKLSSINSDIIVTNNNGAAIVELPTNYAKTLNYTSLKGSGSLQLKDNTNFTINHNSKSSAVSVPQSWPILRNGNFNYSSGNGSAKINIDLKNSSFSFNK